MSARRHRRTSPAATGQGARGGSQVTAPARTGTRQIWFAVAGLGVVALAWLAGGAIARRTVAARLPELPDLSSALPAVRDDLVAADRAARASGGAAAAIGELGMVYHGAQLPVPALQSYAVAAAADPSDWRWPYLRGLLLEERGDHLAAHDTFEQVTVRDPANGPAWFHLGEIQFKQRNAEAAAAAYRRAIESPTATETAIAGITRRTGVPLSAYGEFGLARVLIERGAIEEAATALDALVLKHPAFGPARGLRYRLRNPGGSRGAADDRGAYVPPADSVLDTMVARSHLPELLLKHAALAGRRGDGAWREFLARRALAADPRGLDVLMEMAATLQAANRHTEALEFLRQAESVAPGDHHLLVEQGKSLADLGRLDEAEGVLRRAARVRDAAAEYNLGTVLDRANRPDEARSHYEQAMTINPFHVRAMNNLGALLDRRGQTRPAIALYERALAVDPTDAAVLSNLGTALINERRFDAAVQTLRTAVSIDPGAPNAHNNLGIALAQSGRIDDALAAFKEALRLDPRHQDARRNLDAVANFKK